MVRPRSLFLLWAYPNILDLDEREAEALGLASQLTAALLLIQGVSLNHVATKAWLGRKYPLEVRSSKIHFRAAQLTNRI